MSDSLREKIKIDLQQAKTTGQFRAGRIREIVRSAISQVASELNVGTQEIRASVKDAIAVVTESLHEQKDDVQAEVTASIEGAIEGISQSQRQMIAEKKTKVKQLQDQLTVEEDTLQQNIDHILTDVEIMGRETPDQRINAAIQSALQGIRNSEEVELLQKRYAQLQTQAAIIKANLAARYSNRSEEIKGYLDEAQKWYTQTQQKAKVVSGQIEQQHSHLEHKMGEAGTAIAKGEHHARGILRELLQIMFETLQNHSHSNDNSSSTSSEISQSKPN